VQRSSPFSLSSLPHYVVSSSQSCELRQIRHHSSHSRQTAWKCRFTSLQRNGLHEWVFPIAFFSSCCCHLGWPELGYTGFLFQRTNTACQAPSSPPHPKTEQQSPHFLLTMDGCNQVVHQPSFSSASVTNSTYFSMRSTEAVNSNKTFIFMSLLWHLVFMSAL